MWLSGLPTKGLHIITTIWIKFNGCTKEDLLIRQFEYSKSMFQKDFVIKHTYTTRTILFHI